MGLRATHIALQGGAKELITEIMPCNENVVRRKDSRGTDRICRNHTAEETRFQQHFAAIITLCVRCITYYAKYS